MQIVAQNTAVMSNPGSNLITGNGTSNEIDWIVDEGQQRTDGTTTYSDGSPVLYAYNALTMQPIWSSAYQDMGVPGGKYNSIAVSRGDVYVGTDRIQAFGLTTNTIVDDSVSGTGMNQFTYVGSGWTHVTGSSTMGTFDGTVSIDNVQNDYTTLQFTGSAISVYANELTSYGTATFSIDGGGTQTVTLKPANSSPNGAGAGDVKVFTASGMSAGTHTLKILNAASGNVISIDRVQITPLSTANASLGVSMTDGNVVPVAMGVVPYTINYNNAGVLDSAPVFTGTTTSGRATVTGIFSTSGLFAGLSVTGTGIPANTQIQSVDSQTQVTLTNSATASGTISITPVGTGTGVNATSVVLTDTVQANTHADLANSTPGWTLVSGSGGAGSVYTFSVGNLNAGVTGSVVFSVDLNATIPVGTTTVSNSISISDAAADAASASRTTPIPPPAESGLIFSQEPPAIGSAGIPLSPAVTVSVEDQFGNTYTADSASTVQLTLNGGTFSGGGNTTTAIVTNGVATFSNLVITTSGTYTLTASDGALTGTNSSSFFIANSAKLGFLQQPTQTTAGVAVSPSVTVAVENQAGATITTDTSTVILTINQGSFDNGSKTVAAQCVNGVATFNNLVIDATGSYTLVASDGALQQAQSNSFNIVATASHLVFTQQPNNTYLGEAVNPSVAVSLEDGFGNIATGDTSNVTLTLSGSTLFGGGTTATVAAVNGVASFNNLVVSATGTYTLAASDSSLTPATSNSFVIGTPGAPGLTTIDDSDPQVVYSGTWTQTSTSLANNFGGTVTSDSSGGDNATVTFSGTLITLYAVESPTAGSAQVFIDGNDPIQVNLYSPTAIIAPVFTSGLLTPGSHTIIVKVASGNVSIDHFVVGPATPTLAWATPADLVYGTALDGTELDAYVTNYANFPGTFTYSPPLGTMLPVGQDQVLRVTFVPQDSTDYGSATAQVLINVDQATPLITWTGPDTDMFYGQALSSAQLDATATINGVTLPGNFVYTPDIGTVPPTGADFDLSVTFTPKDTIDYATVTVDQDVDVDPATPVITWNNPADIVDGTALSSTQLNAIANVPGTFVYTPPAGTVLPVGQNQSLGVFFTPMDTTNYNPVGASANLNVDYGPAAQLAFDEQPTATSSGSVIAPAVTVAVKDSAGTTLPGDTSTVTLTLSSGTFVGGGTTVTAQAVGGVATFSSLAIANNGAYTLTATDASLSSALSNIFNIGASAFVNFNTEATDFTAQFATNEQPNDPAALFWGAAAGVDDQSGGAAGGGVNLLQGTDETANYTPTTFNLSDGNPHTVSIFLTAASGLGTGDRNQLGFITSSTASFNSNNSFISARIYGDDSINFQYCNGPGGATTVPATGVSSTGVATGDWLELVFTAQETSSGNFTMTASLLDYGASGTAIPTIVTAPITTTVSALTTIGTGSTMYAGFRTATGGEFNSPLNFDNFGVDLAPAKMAYLAQPSIGVAGAGMGPFEVALEDSFGNIVVGDTSAVTLTLTHGTFSNGHNSVTANAVDGIATFNNLVFSTPDSYTLVATDANPNLDPGFGPIAVVVLPVVTTQPANQVANAGDTVTFTAAASGSPAPTVQWQLSTDGGASFSDISGATSTTLTLTNVNSSLNNNQYRAVFSVSVNASVVGTATTNAAALNIITAPSVTTQPTNQTAGTGTTATFTAAASGVPAPTVQWYVNANNGAGYVPISGATSATLTLTNVSTSQNQYSYKADFTNLAGTIAANTATLTVKTTPILTWTNAANITDSTPLSATQLSAAANVPGIFVYSPPAGTLLGVGLLQPLTVSFTPTDTVDYASASATAYVNVNVGTATALAFVQQPPASAAINAILNPAITVAVKDAAGATVTSDTSTVTLTLSSGTFVGGSTTATAQAVNGVATFNSLSIANDGNYTLTATDALLTAAVSSGFYIGPTAFVNYNSGSNTFTSQFAVNSNVGNVEVAGGTNLTWGATSGVMDQTGGAAGGSVASTATTDTSVSYTPTTFNLSDGLIHTASQFVMVPSGTGGGDKILQIGFVTASTSGFNGGFAFLSARIFGNQTAEVQTVNTAGTGTTSIDPTGALSGIITGHWLQLVFTTQEIASGSFNGTFSILDYGTTGVGTPTTILAPTSYSVTGLTAMGTASSVYAGFRSTVSENLAAGSLEYDNFAVDQPASAPTVAIQPSNVTVTSGNSTSFSAAPVGNSAQSVQWQMSTNGGATFTNVTNGGVYSGVTTVTLSISSTTGLNGNLYRAVFSTVPRAPATSTAASLSLTASGGQIYPTVTTQPSSSTVVNAGSNATITASAKGKSTGTGNLTVQWYVSNGGSFTLLSNGGLYSWAGSVSSAGSPVSDTLTITGATSALNGNLYEAVFSISALGSAPSNPSTLTVSSAPAITGQPSNQTVNIGGLASFTAAASGNPTPTVQWQLSTNGGGAWNNINGATSPTLTFNSVTASQAGAQYRAVFTNSLNTATANAATLTLNTNVAVLSTPSSPVPQGTPATFTAMIAGSPSVGTVSFYIGSVSLGNQIGSAINVSGGSATSASFSGLSPGSNTIIAVYSGGTGFAGSQGSASITGLTTLTWNGGASGNWTASHWSGTGPAFPVSYVNAIVNTPYIIQVTSTQAANSLSISGGGQVSVAAAASLSVAASTSVSGGSLVVASNGAFSTGGSLGLDAGGSISGGPVSAAAYLFNNGTASANLSGSGPLVKDTSGTVTLSGTNTYGGVTIVKLGTLIAMNPASLPDGSNLIIGAAAGTAFGSCDPHGRDSALATLPAVSGDLTILQWRSS